MFILKYKKIFLGLGLLLTVASFVSLGLYKLDLGIEYTGGSVLEFTLKENIDESVLNQRLETGFKQGFVLRKTEAGYILKIKSEGDGVTHNVHVLNVISNNNPDILNVSKFDTIGPTLGNELKTKASVALILVILAIALFIAYAFRHVSEPVSSWKYGLITMIALLHDIVITLGVFSYLGHTMGLEIDSLFLTALLVILGYSINDTIVVFDRIRENLLKVKPEKRSKDFEVIVGESLSQTFVRSLNTTITTLLSLVIIYVLTPASIHNFALALIIGITSGAYSSLFIAAPLLTYFNREQKA
jgi:preprotein translocase subunit SecF